MAVSKYQKELEDFKKKLPQAILYHAEKNGLELCASGLDGLFQELGVPWDRPRTEFHVNLSLRVKLTTSNFYDDEVDDNGEIELSLLEDKLKNFLNAQDIVVNNSLSVDDVYT